MYERIVVFFEDESGKGKITKDKLFVIGLTGLLIIFAYGYIKKEYDKSLTLGASTVEKINDKDPEALEQIEDLPLDLEKVKKKKK